MTEAYFNGLQGLSTEFDSKKFVFITKRMSLVPGYYVTEEECNEQQKYMRKYPHYVPNAEDIQKDMEGHPKRSQTFDMLKWSHRWDILFTDFLLLSVVPNYAIVRRLFNLIHDTRMFFLKNFPILAIFKFGYKNAYVRVLTDK